MALYLPPALTEQGPQRELEEAALEILGVEPPFITGWRINSILDGGMISAYVPRDHYETSAVPTNPRNVDELVKLFDEFAQKVGGTGQRDPGVLGHVPEDDLYMVDGFHRDEVQERRGVPLLLVTVEPNMTYEEVVQRRLEYARKHPEIEFARQVDWVQSVWERTAWSVDIPNVLTAFRAIKPDYADEKTDDVKQIDSLSDADYQAICDWVVRRSKEWGYSPAEIRENLAKAEGFDQTLMHLVYQGSGKLPPGRIGLLHMEAINITYAGEFDLHAPLVDIIINEQLTPQQTSALIREIENGSPRTAEDIVRLANDINILRLKAKVRNARSLGKTSRRGVENLRGLNPSDALRQFHSLLPDISALEPANWTQRDVDVALDISVTLAEAVAQLSIHMQGKD